MKLLFKNESEFFITRMRWLVLLGTPFLFYLTRLPMDTLFWMVFGVTVIVNLYVHWYLMHKPVTSKHFHFLSLVDTVFVSSLLFIGGKEHADLHQLYYFLILVLGIRYGIKSYFGLVLVIGLIYTAVSVATTYYYDFVINTVQLATQLIYFLAFGMLASFILEREHRQSKEKEELISELQVAYQQLCHYNAKVEEMAKKDPLTNLFNYRYFNERLEHEIEWAVNYHKPLSIVMIDIDHFKVFNDTYGHPAGDKALQTAASVFMEKVRDRDLVARYGGEEFLILLPDTDITEAVQCAERIRNAISATKIRVDKEKTDVYITISSGVASLSKNSPSAPELIRNADKALYQAKAGGRNKVQIFDE